MPGHTYRVILNDDLRGVARTVEFEASGAESVLHFVGRHCDGRLAEISENGRSLGLIQNHRNGGFWTIGGASIVDGSGQK